jgi:prepilin-type N-terminal cleavage/methylation domain-containing protein
MNPADRRDAGFGLAEVLAAMAVVAVGLLAALTAVQLALAGIEAGRGETLATFLVEQKLEELKAIALVDWTHVALAPATTTEFCHPTGTGCRGSSAPGLYRRATVVTNGSESTCGAPCKIVRVVVSYSSISTLGTLDRERQLEATTLFVSRA